MRIGYEGLTGLAGFQSKILLLEVDIFELLCGGTLSLSSGPIIAILRLS